MSIKLYDLCGRDNKRFSPFGWRTRMALVHKGLETSAELVRFTEKEKLEFSGQKLVPVIVDGETVVNDSWAIAEYLEDTYPELPSLFGSAAGRGMAKTITKFVDMTILPKLPNLIIADLVENVDERCRPYFIESREKRFGKSLAEVQEGRDERVGEFRKAMEPIRQVLATQPYICGEAPAYGDIPLFSVLQWSRVGSPYAVIEAGDPIHDWFERMLDQYNGEGRSEAAAS